MYPVAIDLFAGCGGLTTGLKKSGFKVIAAVEYDEVFAGVYRSNHLSTKLIVDDIREISSSTLYSGDKQIDLIAGCPPCQGFSSLKTKNKDVTSS